MTLGTQEILPHSHVERENASPHGPQRTNDMQLKTLMVGHGGSSASLYLADPTSPPTVHQLSRLAL